MQLDETYIYSSPDVLPQAPAKARCDAPSSNMGQQYPAPPVKGGLYPTLSTIGSNSAAPKVTQTSSHTTRATTTSSGCSGGAIVAIVIGTIFVLAGVATGIYFGVINATVATGAEETCSPSQFTCVNGGIYGNCIISSWECDNSIDCTGGTDEQNCDGISTTSSSSTNYYQCPDDTTNTEISQKKVCDGNEDCPGGADEDRCIIMPNGNSNGDVQIYIASTASYSKICYDGWTTAQSDALCTHLGYSSSVSTTSTLSTEHGITSTGTFDLSTFIQSTPSSCSGIAVVKIVCSESTSCGSYSRIVGGEDAHIKGYPWQISLQILSSGSWSHTCGGTIVDERWVITAANCVESSSLPSNYRVVAGTTRLSTAGLANEYPVTSIVSHPLYASSPYNMDIALILVSNNFVYSTLIQPVCLPATGQTFADQSDVLITGWGTTSSGGSSPDVLQTVTLPLYNSESCKSTFPNMAGSVSSGNLCAGLTSGGKDSCQGDAGGPMIIDSGGRDYLAGVTIWGFGCAQPNLPGVYSDFSYFIDWINREKSKRT